jgi:hypothetical protein
VLGTTAPYIWGVYLRQQMLQPVANILMTAIGMVLSLMQIQRWYRWSRSNSNADCELGAILGGMLTICVTWPVLYVLADAALHLLNPEFYAIDALLHGVRGGK